MIYALASLAAVALVACIILALPAWVIGRLTAAIVRFIMEESR